MEAERTEAEKRAEGIQPRLTVRTDAKGRPVWLACWRDSTGRSMMRTVGPARLVPIAKSRNTFVAKSEDAQRAKYTAEAWRMAWTLRGNSAKDRRDEERVNVMNDREAMKRAEGLVLARETERIVLRERLARAKDPRTFAQVADRWLEEKTAEVKDGTLAPSTFADYAGMLRRPTANQSASRRPRARVMRAFGHRAIREITGQDISDLLQTMRDEDGLSERTRRKYAVVLRQVFAFSVEEKWLTHNPALDRKRQKRVRRQRKSITVYSVEQVEQIARQAGGQDGEIIRLAAYTGLRQGELLALRWWHIDWTTSSIRVQASWDYRAGEEGSTKSGESRTVPLADDAAEVLQRIGGRGDTAARDLVFPGHQRRSEHVDPSALRRRYVKAREAVRERDPDCPKIVFHDLRHTFGSLLAAGGVPLLAIKEYMGHQDLATTSVYLHFVPRDAAAAEVTRALRRGTVREVEVLQADDRQTAA